MRGDAACANGVIKGRTPGLPKARYMQVPVTGKSDQTPLAPQSVALQILYVLTRYVGAYCVATACVPLFYRALQSSMSLRSPWSRCVLRSRDPGNGDGVESTHIRSDTLPAYEHGTHSSFLAVGFALAM